MRARENVKLFFENRRKTDVTSLVRIDRYVFIAHASLLVTKFFSVVRVFFNLLSKVFNLLLIVIKTLAQMLFHIFDFGILREQMKQVLNFQYIPSVDNLQRLFNVNFLLSSCCARNVAI